MLTNNHIEWLAAYLKVTKLEMAETLGIGKSTMQSWLISRAPRIQRHHEAIINSMCVRLVQQKLEDVLAIYDLEGV